MTLVASLVEVSNRVAGTSSRTAKIRALAECLRTLEPHEIEIAVQYLAGELPQGRIGISYSTLQSAASSEAALVPTLSITDLDQRVTELAALRGSGSSSKRASALKELFARSTAVEREFIMRLLVGELRQGALGGVMLDAIVTASNVAADEVRRAAMYSDNLGALAKVALLEGAAGLHQFQLELLSPIAPMLAQTAADVSEALEQLGGQAILEWKMDGARIQVHKSREDVRVFTRNSNDVTHAIPEIVAAVRELPTSQIILDGEAITYTPGGRPHTFQTTMRRFGRKLDVAKLQAELPIRAYFFDCLYFEGESVAHLTTMQRTEVLYRGIPNTMRMPRLVTSSLEEAQAFYDDALRSGHEGLMAKALDAPYEAGNRGASWLKIKRAHTLDLVVLAAEWGHGRRTGKLSNLHLGALDRETGEYVMLGKTFKGLTDAMLEWQTKEFLAREIHRDHMTVYVRPEIVVEIAFSDLQASPRYPGGLALRLARVKQYRTDKPASEADTMESVRKVFEAQG